jgi:hypothetical protein
MKIGDIPSLAVPSAVSAAPCPHVDDDVFHVCMERCEVAREVHAELAAFERPVERSDIEKMLLRATGRDLNDVKIVIARHASTKPQSFSKDALSFLSTINWTDVVRASTLEQGRKAIDDDQRSHDAFIRTDASEHEKEVLAAAARQKQKTTALEREADALKNGVNPSSKEAFLLLRR